MVARPTEIKAVAELLQGPADNANDLAKKVIEALDDLRRDRPSFIIVKAFGRALLYSYGPFPTRNKAEHAMKRGIIPIIEGESWAIGKLWSETKAEESRRKADAPVQLTLKNKDQGRHPVPYSADEAAEKKRYATMSRAERKREFQRRLP